jgi:uncharacterized protein YjbJ (UPF0337 family)
MPESAKDMQGRGKEAAGDLTGDEQLRREGKADQAGEKAKGAVDRMTESVKSFFGRRSD